LPLIRAPPWHQGKPPRPVQQQSSSDVLLQLLAQVPGGTN
jgi:hypothetical protein